MSQADSSQDCAQVRTIAPSDRDHVEMSVTLDVSDLAPPERIHLVEKAEQYEDELLETVDDMRERHGE